MEKVYLYDDMHVFITAYNCEQDPLDDGRYLIPSNATSTPPPVLKDNEVAVWAGKKWEVKVDYSNGKGYSTENGQEVEITEIGELPANVTLTPRPSEYHTFKSGKWTVTKADAARKQTDEARAHNATVFAQIEQLEQKQQRPLREAALATLDADRAAARERIKQLDEQIQQLRTTLKTTSKE